MAAHAQTAPDGASGIAPAGAESPQVKSVYYDFAAGFSYRNATINGYRGKVGEYETLDPGMEASYSWQAYAKEALIDLRGNVFDKDVQDHSADIDYRRYFTSENTYQRFRHYLDHDDLANQDFANDFDAGRSNSIIREEFISKNTLRLPFLPGVKLIADYRQLDKRGHRQATTVGKCTSCHVTSRNRRINQTTRDITVGTQVKLGIVTLRYTHLQRRFDEGGAVPMADYGNNASSFPVQGYRPYNDTPDTITYVNTLSTSVALPMRSSLYADFESGTHKNRETHEDRTFESYAVRLTNAALKYVTFNFNHFDYNQDSDVSGALEKDFSRTGFSFRTISWKKTFLRGSYRWEDIDRNNSAESSSLKRTLTLGLYSRFLKRVTFNIRYRNELIDDPYVMEKWESFFLSQRTSEPSRLDALRVTCSWTIRSNLSLTSMFNFEDKQSSRYDVDEERTEFVVSVWYAPFDRLTVTGSYSLIDTDISSETSYKTYHRTDFSDYLLDRSTPYDDRSSCYSFNVNYQYSYRLALIGAFTYITSQADYDTRWYYENTGRYSDEHINRIDGLIGVDYLYSRKISLYARYNYRDYDDRENSDLDGRAHIVGAGINVVF